jgi:hypothetical protein
LNVRPHVSGAFRVANSSRLANRTARITVPEQTLTEILILLTNVEHLYLEIHGRKIERMCWINGLSLQMTDPNGE